MQRIEGAEKSFVRVPKQLFFFLERQVQCGRDSRGIRCTSGIRVPSFEPGC